MSVRDVPLEVITEVPAANLQNVGASASTARLKKTSIGGVQEEMAIEQAQFAVSSMRLVNSNILSMSSLRQLLSSVTDQVDCLVEEDDNPDRFSNLRSDLQLMGHAIVDMDGGNGDLLKITASQFNEAHRTRSNAWIDATKLPGQMKKELKVLKQPTSSTSTTVTPLLSDEVSLRVRQHVQSQRDNAWRWGAASRQSRPQRQQRRRPQNSNRGNFAAHSNNWSQQNQGQQNQNQNQNRNRGGQSQGGGRGRGGNQRGGKGRGFSGTQASNQPK